MDFEAFFAGELDAVRADGRYRVFTDIKRHRGRFPHATRFLLVGTPSGITVIGDCGSGVMPGRTWIIARMKCH